MTINTSTQGCLSRAGEEAFMLAYQSTSIFHAQQPTVRFPRSGASIFRELAKLRMKDYRSTDRWNSVADETGLLGELAVHRYFNMPAEIAMVEFINGLKGDKGHDIEIAGLKLDVKSTRGDALRYKFSKTNPYANLADGFLFVHVHEQSGLREVWVRLLGWSYRSDLKPYLRDDGKRIFVRLETLRRAEVLKPVSLLKACNDSNNQLTEKE